MPVVKHHRRSNLNKFIIHPRQFALGLIVAALVASAGAQSVPSMGGKPYSGVITLQVDVSNLDQKIFQIKQSLPVKPGKLTLQYAKWLPGHHSPSNPLNQLGGLIFKGNGKTIEWHRDGIDMYAFHLDIPADVSTLEAQYQFLSPIAKEQGRITSTSEIVGVQWNALVLYPAGYPARGITCQASVKLPAGWQFGGALEQTDRKDDVVSFKAVNLDQLIDSPLFAGKYFKRIDLDPNGNVPVHLNIVADSAASLEAKPEHIEAHRTLVQQAYKLYGSQHYSHYDFLLALSDGFSGIGLEHHQSSENGVEPDYFTEWDKNPVGRDLLAHEYTHSWNGKFRRPQEQITANFNEPLQNSLLWVYEGQTQYWGNILAARSGLISAERVLESIATAAASYDNVAGRQWRAMQDTTNDPIITSRSSLAWGNWQRNEDYYTEGQLIWLDVDSKIRELSGEQRSLNDFAKLFFGTKDGSYEAFGYDFNEVVKTLNAVQAYDWTNFLRSRLDGHGPGAPLDGLTRSGWKLVYTDTPTEYLKNYAEKRHVTSYDYSLGFSVDKENKVGGMLWEGPAFKSAMRNGGTLLAVNGIAFTPKVLNAAVTLAKTDTAPIELLIKQDDRFRSYRIDYHVGLRYPRLERIANTPDRLAAILAPMK